MDNTVFICFLDKIHPPDHSFVSGMLAQSLPRLSGVYVWLLVGTSGLQRKSPLRYFNALSIPCMPARGRGVANRVRSLVYGMCTARTLINKSNRQGKKVVLFVRNDALLLCVASVLRSSSDCLIFQSSFPHESSHKLALKRWLHKFLFRICGRNIDAVLAVSPAGLERTRNLFPDVDHGGVIPLLSDLPASECGRGLERLQKRAAVKFIYIGKHNSRRHLDVVMKGIVLSLDSGIDAEFSFVGGNSCEISQLRGVDGVEAWERKRRIEFIEPVARARIPNLLAESDVGLCLLPPLREYWEASPTKLAEYLGAGLAVLASRGVALQERFVREAQAGLLVPYEIEAIASAIKQLVEDRESLAVCQKNAAKYSRHYLRYDSYVPILTALVDR